MLLLDVNVVLAAHRDDHPDHDSVRLWFDEMVKARERFTVPAFIWASFLRLATNRRIFPVPTPLSHAFGFIEAVCGQPTHLSVGPGPRHVALLRELCEESEASGDLVPDAVLAALAVEHGCEIITLDRDFGRFRSVRHRPPTPSGDAGGRT